MDVVSLVVTVLGFAATIWQLTRTANASEAAATTLKKTATRMSANYLLVLAPQLRIFENDLDYACDGDDVTLARRTLVGYGQMASQVAALIDNADGANTELQVLLRESARSASEAKIKLLESSGVRGDVAVIVKDVLKQIGQVSNELSALIPKLQLET